MNIYFTCPNKLDNFLKPVKKALSDMIVSRPEIADMIWIEWGDRPDIINQLYDRFGETKKIVVRAHGFEIVNSITERINKEVTILAVSPLYQQKLIDQGFKDVRVIGNCIDTETFNIDRKIISTDINIGLVGWIEPNKNQIALLALTDDIKHKVYIKYAGKVRHPLYERYYTALRRIVMLDRPGRVEVVGYIEDRQEMAAFYNSLDIIALLSERESFGVSVMEGMACGCYPFVSTVEDLSCIYNDFYVKPKQAKQRLKEIIKERLYIKKRKEVREFVVDNHGLTAFRRKVMEVL